MVRKRSVKEAVPPVAPKLAPLQSLVCGVAVVFDQTAAPESVTWVTVTVMSWVSVPPLPSETVTVTS